MILGSERVGPEEIRLDKLGNSGTDRLQPALNDGLTPADDPLVSLQF